jgi:hypothetical protein
MTAFVGLPTARARMNDRDPGSIAQRRFRDIVPPLLDDAYTLAKWICRNGADAEDIVQEAAIRALKALETTAIERPKPWFLSAPRRRGSPVEVGSIQIIVGWSGSWQAARLGNWPSRSLATKAALGG